MSAWQLIETAPKDGTAILIAGEEDDELMYAPTGFEDFMRLPCRAVWHINEWIMTFCEAGFVCCTYSNPTHWMPLPDPPEQQP